MPTASAHLTISLRGSVAPAAPRDGALGAVVENGSSGDRWTNGQAAGMVDRIYRRDSTLAAAATDSYDLLAAGSLTDILTQAVDLDEAKAMVLACLTGSIKMVAPALNFLPIFGGAGHLINLSAGQMMAFDLGASGLLLSANAKFEITDTFGGTGSTYSIMIAGSN